MRSHAAARPAARTHLRERGCEAALHGRNGLCCLLRLCGRVVLAKDRCQGLQQQQQQKQASQTPPEGWVSAKAWYAARSNDAWPQCPNAWPPERAAHLHGRPVRKAAQRSGSRVYDAVAPRERGPARRGSHEIPREEHRVLARSYGSHGTVCGRSRNWRRCGWRRIGRGSSG